MEPAVETFGKSAFIRAIGYVSTLCFASMILFAALDIIFPLPTHKLYPEPSKTVFDRNGRIMRVFLAPDDMWRMPVELDSISATLRLAVITYEDRHFYHHFGIDPVAVIRAAAADIGARDFVQGASTITMQVARMIEPKERTIGGKLIEAFRAIQLEMEYTKDEILALYLNHAPYGGNIVGVKAASYLYFGKSPVQVSVGDAALLAAIPNSPNRLRPDLNPDRALKARTRVLEILEAEGGISSSQKADALSEPIAVERFSMPFEIPHLSVYLQNRYPRSEHLVTTIDSDIQKLAERMLSSRLGQLGSKGIRNGAAVVIDNESRDLLAMVGSSGFFDIASEGQVNGAMSPRSPGSALKPFAYALCLDRGIISPQSMLYDVPVNYSGYSPENYDSKYHGAVSARQALVSSFNVPAVGLCARLGENGIYEFLRNAGISTLTNPKQHYGLSLILGGCEVTLLELTNLYVGLANEGGFAECHLLKDEQPRAVRQLLSPETCYILSEILTELRRPDLPSVWEWSLDMPKVAWKTGTSYGRRDAWSVGYTPRYTVGVWIGNFDGRGVPELVGAEAAAPVLFGIIGALEKDSKSEWFVEPDNIEHRQVCSVSGMPLSDLCSSASDELYIPGVSPHGECSVHRKILIDSETGYRLCRRCCTNRECRELLVEQWPAEIATWFQRNGFSVDKIPAHYPGCTQIMTGSAPTINSPANDCEYKLRPDIPLDYQRILLDASVSNRCAKIFWFLDGHLVYAGSPAETVFIDPAPGLHTVVCSDEDGRSSQARFIVR